MPLIKMFKDLLFAAPKTNQHASEYRELIRREAQIGGQLFGPIPAGHRREFFCLDEYTWIWHEEWTDSRGRRQGRTTRYDVRADGILKAQDGQSYQQVSREEAANLVEAARLYQQRVDQELYNLQPSLY